MPTPIPPIPNQPIDLSQLDVAKIIAENSDNPGFGLGLGLPIGIIVSIGVWKILSPILKIAELKFGGQEKDSDSPLMKQLKTKVDELELYLTYYEKLRKYDSIIADDSNVIMSKITQNGNDQDLKPSATTPKQPVDLDKQIEDLDALLKILST